MSLIEATIAAIAPLSQTAMAAALERQQSLTKPPGSLGRLEDVAVWLAGVRDEPVPVLRAPVVVVCAADHGVAAAGVSAYPPAVTRQMVANFLAGGAAINVLARLAGARVVVVDAGVIEPPAAHPALVSMRGGPGTADIRLGPAMSRETARWLMEGGIGLAASLADGGAGAVAVGDMGIGNTTASAALIAAATGRSPEEVTGRGTGISQAALSHKIAVVRQAIAVSHPDPADGVALLAAVGGFEHAVLAGLMLGAAAHRLPVILDGVITTAAALAARAICPAVEPYLLASHRSVEPGHTVALVALNLEPLVDLRLRLGEGSGAALVLPMLAAAAALLSDMATFAQAGVAGAAEPALPVES